MRSRAMTLIELMVVISILVVLAAVAVPTIRSLTQGQPQKQAVNMLTSLLAHARSVALVTHRPTGLVIYEFPASNYTASTTYVQLIAQYSIDGRIRNFGRVAGSGPRQLPAGVQVATLQGSNNFRKSTDQRDSKSRVILFDSGGQMVLWNGLAPDPVLVPNEVVAAWNLEATPTAPWDAVSSPGILVYDAALYLESRTASPTLDASTWLRQHADVFILNPYTGEVIR